MTLNEIKNDPRVYEVIREYDEDFKYEIWLKDGWTFDDNAHSAVADSVKELNQLMKEIAEEDFTETHPEWFGYDNSAKTDETEYVLQIVYADETGRQDNVWSETTTKQYGINRFVNDCPDCAEIVYIEWIPVDEIEEDYKPLTIREIGNKYNMTLKAISNRFEIPYRTIENWSSGKNSCPEYVLKMIDEILANENNPTN